MINLSERPNYIDLAKVIGMYCVLLGHYVYFFDVPFQENSNLWNVTHFVTLFHMPFFFFVSGMLFSNKEKSFNKYTTKQLKTLLIPYVLFCAIVGVAYYAPSLVSGSASVKDIAKYFIGIFLGGDFFGKFSIYPVGPIWFVYALFVIKMVYYLILKINREILCNCCRIAVMGAGVFILCLNKDVLPLRIDSVFVGMIFFIVGHLSKNLVQKILNSKMVSLLILFVSVACLIVFDVFYVDNSIRQGLSINVNFFGKYPPLFLLSGFIGTFAVLSIARLLPIASWSKKLMMLISDGMIVTLATHKVLFFLFAPLLYSENIFAMFLVSALVLLVSVLFIKFIGMYIPALLGYRSVSRSK